MGRDEEKGPEVGGMGMGNLPRRAGTEYAGPVMVTTLAFGGYPVRVVRPADPDRLLDDPGVLDWNRRDDYMPYWAYLWPGAHLLAEAVAREEWAGETERNLSRRWRSAAGWAWPGWSPWRAGCGCSSAITTGRR